MKNHRGDFRYDQGTRDNIIEDYKDKLPKDLIDKAIDVINREYEAIKDLLIRLGDDLADIEADYLDEIKDIETSTENEKAALYDINSIWGIHDDILRGLWNLEYDRDDRYIEDFLSILYEWFNGNL